MIPRRYCRGKPEKLVSASDLAAREVRRLLHVHDPALREFLRRAIAFGCSGEVL